VGVEKQIHLNYDRLLGLLTIDRTDPIIYFVGKVLFRRQVKVEALLRFGLVTTPQKMDLSKPLVLIPAPIQNRADSASPPLP
jgi:hypothetical protein